MLKQPLSLAVKLIVGSLSLILIAALMRVVVVVVGSLRTACSNEDYCSPILCLGAKQRTPSPSSVAFYDMPGKVWAVCIFCVPVHTWVTQES